MSFSECFIRIIKPLRGSPSKDDLLRTDKAEVEVREPSFR